MKWGEKELKEIAGTDLFAYCMMMSLTNPCAALGAGDITRSTNGLWAEEISYGAPQWAY